MNNEEMKMGTPKTLQEAIDRALLLGPMSGIRERTKHAVIDYLAQKFGVALMKNQSPEAQNILDDLWKQIKDVKE